MVETYDQYDNSGTPRLVGADALGPRLQSVAYVAGNDPDGSFLLLDDVANNDFAITNGHMTSNADQMTVFTHLRLQLPVPITALEVEMIQRSPK